MNWAGDSNVMTPNGFVGSSSAAVLVENGSGSTRAGAVPCRKTWDTDVGRVWINVYRLVPHVPCVPHPKMEHQQIARFIVGGRVLPLRIAKSYEGVLRSIPTKVPTVLQKGTLSGSDLACKCLKNMAPQVGFEPTTLRLTAYGAGILSSATDCYGLGQSNRISGLRNSLLRRKAS
jgi:hypothetical protein